MGNISTLLTLSLLILISSSIEQAKSNKLHISRNLRRNTKRIKRNFGNDANNALKIAENDAFIKALEPPSPEPFIGVNEYASKTIFNATFLTATNLTDSSEDEEVGGKSHASNNFIVGYSNNDLELASDVDQSKCKTALDLSLHLGTCLESHESPGCSDETCENVICKEINDEMCCTSQWDSTCASEAKIICIKDLLPKSSCYFYSNSDAGCDNKECESLVCNFDKHCCEDAWSWNCVNKAVDYCCLDSFA